MVFQINDQLQTSGLELTGVTSQISLYPELNCGNDWISIYPSGLQNVMQFFFTLDVREQNLYRIMNISDPAEIFFSVQTDMVSAEKRCFAFAGTSPVRGESVRCYRTSSLALYKAVGRMRL